MQLRSSSQRANSAGGAKRVEMMRTRGDSNAVGVYMAVQGIGHWAPCGWPSGSTADKCLYTFTNVTVKSTSSFVFNRPSLGAFVGLDIPTISHGQSPNCPFGQSMWRCKKSPEQP